MTLQDWGSIGEIVGGIAVLCTLIYLTYQVRQTSNAIKASSSVMGADFNGLIFHQWVENKEFAEIYLKAIDDIDLLDQTEYFRFNMFVNQVMRYFEHQYFLHLSDALPDGFWESQQKSIEALMSEPALKSAWDNQTQFYSSKFQDLVDAIVSNSSGEGLQQLKESLSLKTKN